MLKLAVIALTLSAFCSFASAGGCVKPHSTHIDSNFLLGSFTILKHSDTEMFNKIDKNFEFMGKPVNSQSLCWETSGILKDGSLHKVNIKCDHTNPAEHSCALTKEEQEKFPHAKGSVVVTSTDNSTYIAGITCVSGRASYWWIASTNGAPLDSGVEKRILMDFKRTGLETAKIAVERESVVTFKEFNLLKGDC